MNLALAVPTSYIEMIYDCIIQMCSGLEFAHNNDVIHGQIDLSNIIVSDDQDYWVFKLNNFKHSLVLAAPLPTDGSMKYWNLTDAQKKELLMVKDIYQLGICLLELMMGIASENKYSITIDSLPLTWAELPESTPLIQALVEFLNEDSIS